MNTETQKRRAPRSVRSHSNQSSGGNSSHRRSNFRGRRGSSHNRRGRGGRGFKVTSFDPSRFINKNPVEMKEEVYAPQNTFETFGVDERLVKAITGIGITTPSPIQDQVIPEILQNKDVVGLAETGTGKTAAFLIPLIDKTLRDKTQQTLILTPTRELALQIHSELLKLGTNMGIYATTCVGGMNIRPQIRNLRRTRHFIIGTPGRILDLIDRKILATDKITNVVLDEADRMLDMGFIHDMRKIISTTPSERSTLFFSATMNKETEKLTHEFLTDPVTISVKKKDVTNSIEQDVVYYGRDRKFETLLELLEDPELKRVLIFGLMKHSVRTLAKQIAEHGIKTDSIHGNKSHIQRQQALKRFKSGQVRVLVATDVAARGIHVDNVTHVINYDLPTAFEDYIHRIGRTGRGDKKGKALTFIQK